jgi:MFS family permease
VDTLRSNSRLRMLVERPAAFYSLAFLTLISSFNYFDRSLLGLVLPLIQKEMQLTDTQLGLVSGLAFVVFYSALGVPIAWLADRWNRRNIIAIGFAFWSLMTLATGFVANVVQLAAARFLMGAGEACGLAPSNSMLADLFDKGRRPMALAVFGTASAISFIVFFPIAGWVSDAYGWRAAFVAAGLPGLLLSMIFIITVKEPQRGAAENSPKSALPAVSLAQTLRFLRGSRAYVLTLLGVSFMGANAYAASTWSTTFLVRVHGLSLTEIAATLGPIRGVLSGVGVLLGGYITTQLTKRDERWRLWVPAIACLAVVPAEILFLLGDAHAIWILGLAGASLFTFMHQAPVLAACLNVSGVRMRAVAVSLTMLCSSLIGQAVGPLLVGDVNDTLAAVYGAQAIRYSMLLVAACAGAAAFCFWRAARFLPTDTQRAEST